MRTLTKSQKIIKRKKKKEKKIQLPNRLYVIKKFVTLFKFISRPPITKKMPPSSHDDIPFFPNIPTRFSHIISYVDFNQVWFTLKVWTSYEKTNIRKEKLSFPIDLFSFLEWKIFATFSFPVKILMNSLNAREREKKK